MTEGKMTMRSKRSAAFVFVVLLIAAGLMLRWFFRPDTESYFTGEIGQAYLLPDGRAIPSTTSGPEAGGSVRGTIVDELNAPAHGLEVELIPANKTADERWYATKHEWTDATGQFQFRYAEPGEYFVAVLKHAAPDARHPFAGAYYPAADDEPTADHILVTQSSPTELLPMHLQRIETVTLKINVAFEDGTSPDWSNLLFHNLSYPDQAVIGDEAPGIEGGRGQFTLPKGFEYSAQAKVDCDAGPKIETRESLPVQRVKVEDGFIPEDLLFIIPGLSCKLWSPK